MGHVSMWSGKAGAGDDASAKAEQGTGQVGSEKTMRRTVTSGRKGSKCLGLKQR